MHVSTISAESIFEIEHPGTGTVPNISSFTHHINMTICIHCNAERAGNLLHYISIVISCMHVYNTYRGEVLNEVFCCINRTSTLIL